MDLTAKLTLTNWLLYIVFAQIVPNPARQCKHWVSLMAMFIWALGTTISVFWILLWFIWTYI